MALTAYESYANIFVKHEGADDPFKTKVFAILKEIDGLDLGRELLNEISMAGRQCAIAPLREGQDTGNKCVSAKSDRFMMLRQSFMGIERAPLLSSELQKTFDNARVGGLTVDFVAEQISAGLTPSSVKLALNVVRPVAKSGLEIAAGMAPIKVLIRGLLAGTSSAADARVKLAGDYSLADLLMRMLRAYCQPGLGANAQIYFSPSIKKSCVGDGVLKDRPVGIGMAHELMHAWRNVTGRRLFDDAQSCGLDDDEVMTTGIPPYNNEKFTENRFRSIWPRAWYQSSLAMRENYR